MLQIKKNNDKFDSLEEFTDNINRGGEIEFTYNNKNYSITHGQNGELYYTEAYNEAFAKAFNSIDELLEHRIDGREIRNIVTEMQPYFRCF